MADLSNPLTQVVVGQSQPAVTVNNLIDALSPAAIFGQNDLTTSGLTWGYYGGRYRGIAISAGTIALPASQSNVYIVAAKATGVVSQSISTTNWNNATDYDRLYLAITGASTITDWDDYREVVSSAGAGVATIDTETIQDIIAALITAGTNVSVQYNDGDSPPTLVINNTATKAPIQVACSDETTALTTGTGKMTFRMPYAMTLTAVRASLTTAQSSGSIFTVDINDSGTTILSTKITIDNTEKTSTTAVTAPVISDTTLLDDAEITVDIDQVGNGTAAGLKVTLIGT